MPRIFSNREYADIHYIYGFCNGSTEAAVREYAARFPDRRQPHRSVFAETHRRLRETGSFSNLSVVRGPVRNARTTERVARYFETNPNTSTRRASLNLDISRITIQRSLRELGMYPYHFTPVQNLFPADYQRRERFCQWYLNLDINISSKILWTDESTFTRTGVFNYHNSHYWCHMNPHLPRISSFQHQFKVNVWAGMINEYLIGPHILPDRINAHQFLQFLNNNLFDLLQDVPLNLRYNNWLQLDGCPAHSARIVRNWLNQHYPEKWIGRWGPVEWPARSPDLTPLDFYLWGRVKNEVYSTPIESREHLIQLINTAFDRLKLNREEIRNATRSVTTRCRKCIEVGGGHFENS